MSFLGAVPDHHSQAIKKVRRPQTTLSHRDQFGSKMMYEDNSSAKQHSTMTTWVYARSHAKSNEQFAAFLKYGGIRSTSSMELVDYLAECFTSGFCPDVLSIAHLTQHPQIMQTTTVSAPSCPSSTYTSFAS